MVIYRKKYAGIAKKLSMCIVVFGELLKAAKIY